MTNSGQQTSLSPAMRAHQIRLGRPLAEVLVSDYADRELQEIAAAFGVSERTIARWLQRLGIERRLVQLGAGEPEPTEAAAA